MVGNLDSLGLKGQEGVHSLLLEFRRLVFLVNGPQGVMVPLESGPLLGMVAPELEKLRKSLRSCKPWYISPDSIGLLRLGDGRSYI